MSTLTVTDASEFEVLDKPIVEEILIETESIPEPLDVEKFQEIPNQIHDVNEYQRLGSDPGLVVIINQLTFFDEHGQPKPRLGTNRDVNELIVTFGRLGFNIDSNYIYTDLTKGEIVATLDKISKEDFTNRNCLIIVMLTHGNKDNLLYAKESVLETADIWTPFQANNCATLKNKPKFFVFQACKGENSSQVDTSASDIISKTFFRSKLDPDTLVAFSAVEGNRAYRHQLNGSWFIQEMCKNFLAYGRRDDVVTLLTRTSKCVSSNYFYISKDHTQVIKKQMPLFVSTLTKRFYLTKSKDRNSILGYLEEQEKIQKTLRELKEIVDILHDEYEAKLKCRKK